MNYSKKPLNPDLSYNFYGYVSVDFFGLNNLYKKYFENEYKRISLTETSRNQVISVFLVTSLPEKNNSLVLRKKIKFKKLFTFEYAVVGLETETPAIYFKRHWMDRIYINAVGVFLQAQIVEPVLYLMLLRTNVLFIHAAGVSKNGKGYIFPAYGGTGKTTLSMGLMKSGCHFLGDDLLFVDVSTNIVYPYMRPLHIFTYNLKTLHESHFPIKYKFAIYFKNILRWFLERMLKQEFLISTRVHIEEIYSQVNVSEPVPVCKVIFLTREGEGGKTKINNENIDKLVMELTDSFDLNRSLIENILNSEDQITNFKNLEHHVARSLINQLSFLYHFNTRSIDINSPQKIIRILDEK